VLVMDGAEVKADLTNSPYLRIITSDPDVLDVDGENAVFLGKKPGHVESLIAFSEATAIVQAFVKEARGDSRAMR
jgi:hypothetical protein